MCATTPVAMGVKVRCGDSSAGSEPARAGDDVWLAGGCIDPRANSLALGSDFGCGRR